MQQIKMIAKRRSGKVLEAKIGSAANEPGGVRINL